MIIDGKILVKNVKDLSRDEGISAERQIILIQDVSCMGRCSVAAALPIISAAGVKVNLIPTAVLSTQTDGFENYTFRDLTDDMLPIAKHWSTLGLHYDAIYTGFLGSLRQVQIVKEIIAELADDDTVIFVDPVLGDDGELYSCYNSRHIANMRELCGMADVITPNVTEAALLAGSEYRGGVTDKDYVVELISKLSKLGVRRYIIITGVCLFKERTGVAVYDCESHRISFFMAQTVEGRFPGAGDVFASSLLAALLSDINVESAAELALKYTAGCIVNSHAAGTEPRFGLDFERGLGKLAKALQDGNEL